jgi:hypothetical protein
MAKKQMTEVKVAETQVESVSFVFNTNYSDGKETYSRGETVTLLLEKANRFKALGFGEIRVSN